MTLAKNEALVHISMAEFMRVARPTASMPPKRQTKGPYVYKQRGTACRSRRLQCVILQPWCWARPRMVARRARKSIVPASRWRVHVGVVVSYARRAVDVDDVFIPRLVPYE